MMSDHNKTADRPSTIPWPPIIYAGALVIAWLLQRFVPLPWLPGMAGELLFAFGALFIVGGIAIVLAAFQTLRKAKTTIRADHGAIHLVTGSVFAWTRNPIYLGATAVLIGIGLCTGDPWYIVLAIIAAFATKKLAIEGEERHLEARFGKAYRDYRKRVSRWI